MTRRTKNNSWQWLAALAAVVAIGLLAVANDKLPWLKLLLGFIWGMFLVVNIVVLAQIFLRSAKASEKWFAALSRLFTNRH